jgi:hypothetical protein
VIEPTEIERTRAEIWELTRILRNHGDWAGAREITFALLRTEKAAAALSAILRMEKDTA